MSAEKDRWNRIQQILADALDVAPDQRPALLARECGDDADLRLEIESLIAASEEADDYFGDLAGRAGIEDLGAESAPTAETIDEDGNLDLSGRRVGAYRLVRLIGRGGMGTVYLAERDDGQFEHRVALKLLPLGTAASQGAHQRFLAERGILARLEHPNIARLLDGGVLEDGTPYFVMELVDGVRIDDYCDERQLDIDARLRLFLSVCDAVSHAHHSLVVHRDLKPANVLVADDEVKLLDFGIAKLIDPEQSLGLTAGASGMAPMTPAFASPEQLRGEPITTATDVYALGVLLHGLLSGLSPYQLEDANPGAMLLAICEQTVANPSSRLRRMQDGGTATTANSATASPAAIERIAAARDTTPAALTRKLRGDLDTIILKALRKDPVRRYGSVGRMADDVRRHLEGYPVTARKETWGYRASRFVKRHKAAAGLAAASVIFLVAFIGTAAWFAVSNAAQTRRIAQERVRAEETLELMTSLYETADPAASPGETVTAREVLDAAVERLQGDENDPETRAQLMLAAGRVYRRLNFSAQARPLLTEALEIRRSLYEAPHVAIAESAFELGAHLYRAGYTQEGITLLEEALESYLVLTGENSVETGRTHFELGTALHDAGQHAPSDREFRRAVEIFKELPPTHTTEHADSLTQLASYISVSGNVEDARIMLEQARTINEELRGPEHPAVAQNLSVLGMLYWNQGDHDRGVELVRQSVDINRNTYGADGHANLAMTLQNLGSLLANDGDPEGFAALREAADMYRRLRIDPMTLGFCLTMLANYYRNDDQQTLAVETYEEALAVYEENEVVGLTVANTKLNYGRVLADSGERERAIAFLEESLAGYEASLPDDHPRIIEIRGELETLRSQQR